MRKVLDGVKLKARQFHDYCHSNLTPCSKMTKQLASLYWNFHCSGFREMFFSQHNLIGYISVPEGTVHQQSMLNAIR